MFSKSSWKSDIRSDLKEPKQIVGFGKVSGRKTSTSRRTKMAEGNKGKYMVFMFIACFSMSFSKSKAFVTSCFLLSIKTAIACTFSHLSLWQTQ